VPHAGKALLYQYVALFTQSLHVVPRPQTVASAQPLVGALVGACVRAWLGSRDGQKDGLVSVREQRVS
jgi:hypothetical protein